MAKETCVRKCRLGSFTICLRCGEGHALILCPPTLPAQQCPENTFNNNRRWKLLMRKKKNYAIKMAGRQRGGMELGSTILRLLYSWFTICASFVFPQFPSQVCAVCFHLLPASAASSSVSLSVFLSTVLLLFLLPLWNEMHQSSEQH